MRKWLPALLALLLPLTGAVAQENEVVALPTVAPLAQVDVSDAVDYTSAPLAEYYTPSENESAVDEQMPRMTAEESERAVALYQDYQAGTRPKETVLNKLENVTVGVYTLNPEDYTGETLYTLLPVTELTDEQILEVIDAFAQCGQAFSPDLLSHQNCMRGGGIEASRFYQEEERARKSALQDLYIRQGLTAQAAYTPLVSDDGLGMVMLEPGSYSGLDRFLFLPYRQMTDDELLGYVIYTDTGDAAEYGNYPAYEKQLRLELQRLLGAPLVMTRQDEGMAVMGDFNVLYEDETVYHAAFITLDGVRYGGYLDVNTHQVLSAYIDMPCELTYSDLHLDPFDERWLTIAQETVEQLRGDGMAVSAVESRGEIGVQYAGYGALIDVIMQDGGHYETAIPYQTGTVCRWIDYNTNTLDPDQRYTMMYE